MAAGRAAVMTGQPEAIHATALVLGEAGVLLRGPSGAGKSHLAQLLLDEAGRLGVFARLVGDDRILLHAAGARLLAAPHPAVAGLLERRTQPFARLAILRRCVVRLVVDLHPADTPLPRYPDREIETIELAEGVPLPLLRLQAPPGALSCRCVLDALPMGIKAVPSP